MKDLEAVAVEGGTWAIYIGGAAGSSVRKGDILVVVDSHDDVLKYMGRFVQYYRENAKYLERTLRLRGKNRAWPQFEPWSSTIAKVSPSGWIAKSRVESLPTKDPWKEIAPICAA